MYTNFIYIKFVYILKLKDIRHLSMHGIIGKFPRKCINCLSSVLWGCMYILIYFNNDITKFQMVNE